MSYSEPGEHSNPFVQLLELNLDNCEIVHFTWRAAFFGTFSVFHLHWPETLVRSDRGRTRRAVKLFLALCFLLKLRLFSIPTVRTIHNSTPHETGGPVEKWVLGRFARLPGALVVMSKNTNPNRTRRQQIRTILHGSYTSILPAGWRSVQMIPGRVGMFGIIRDYKGPFELVASFLESRYGISLTISGYCGLSDDLKQRLIRECAADERVELYCKHLENETLSKSVRECQVIALPYRKWENSGVALYALSLGRTILAPECPETLELQREFGRQFVQLYQGEISGLSIDSSLRLTSQIDPHAEPDMSRRDWSSIGQLYVDLYVNLNGG